MTDNIIYRSPISAIDFKKYYELRWRILRKPWNQPKGSEVNESDVDAFHIMAELNDKIIGVGSIHELEEGIGRIRFMAVDDDWQKHGIGQTVVKLLEENAKSKNWNKVRLWAREIAINFYQNLGYKIISDGYTIFDVIKHKIMEKELSPLQVSRISNF
ncbi:MAG: GNAT family N-acetyltransferase [Planctomycetia bacterium]|nr:GNAT family N-acetyltransferase [Planctomycetia bacterium]